MLYSIVYQHFRSMCFICHVLMMQVVSACEMPLCFYCTTQHHVPEDSIPYSHCPENYESYLPYSSFI